MLNIVNQLRFARLEFRKGFNGVSEEEGARRLMPINSISWMVGHLAWHEQYYWLMRAQGITLIPELNDLAAFGVAASQPSINEMIRCWEQVTQAADAYLDNLKESDLETSMIVKGKALPANIGTMIARMIYHYWYHNGEMQAVRQLLGHKNLQDFVSDDIETIGKYYLDQEEK
jgi:hypothetical protein